MRKSLPVLFACIAPMLASAGPVDINAADAATIARELNGVGESRAQAIVSYREKNGRFASPDDILKVTGIGPHVLKLNRENIRVSPAGKAGAKAAEDK